MAFQNGPATETTPLSKDQDEDLQLTDSDDESFVVLSRSLPPESVIDLSPDCYMEPIPTRTIDKSIEQVKEVIAELSKSEISDKLPSLPKVDGFNKNSFMIPDSTSSLSSNVSDMSPIEVQEKVEGLIEENTKLKDILLQNNIAMKKQFDTIAMWNEDVQKVYEAHKKKFAETKLYIEKLRVENLKLKENLQVSEMTIMSLRSELSSLKNQESCVNISIKKEGENPEIQIKDLENNVDKKSNESKIDLIKTEDEDLQQHKEETESSKKIKEEAELFKKQLLEANDQIKKLREDLSFEHKQSIIKQSQLIEEIEAVKAEHYSENLEMQKNLNILSQQLMAAQMQITELQNNLEQTKKMVEEKNDEILKLQMILNTQSLQAKNLDRTVLNEKESEIIRLNDLVSKLRSELEEFPVLRAQLDIYKEDFEAERQTKCAMKSEKEAIAEDLRALQRRNQQLLEELEKYRPAGDFDSSSFVNVNTSEVNPSAPPMIYTCPKCNFRFRNEIALHNHVYHCIELDALP